MTILSIRDLKVDYATQDGIVQAVDGVSLDVAEGQQLGLIGESGCGKTTLLKAIVQVLPRNGKIASGQILFKGMDLLNLPPAEMRQLRWQEIATVPQASMDSLNPVQRVGSQLMKLLTVRGGYDKRTARRRAVDLFDLVGLDTGRLMHYPHEFSGGMKQRAVIAMALALKPSLLIADEPVTALDVIVQHQILEVLRNLQREFNLTVMLITHDISVVAQICDSVSVMYAGQIVEQAAAKPFFHSPAILTAWACSKPFLIWCDHAMSWFRLKVTRPIYASLHRAAALPNVVPLCRMRAIKPTRLCKSSKTVVQRLACAQVKWTLCACRRKTPRSGSMLKLHSSLREIGQSLPPTLSPSQQRRVVHLSKALRD